MRGCRAARAILRHGHLNETPPCTVGVVSWTPGHGAGPATIHKLPVPIALDVDERETVPSITTVEPPVDVEKMEE